MHPILFEILSYKVYSYGFSTIIACCLCTWLVFKKHPDYLELNDIVNFCLLALFSILLADKLILMMYNGFRIPLGEFLQLSNQPMHSFYGTLWMALILIYIYCMLKKIPLWPTLDCLLYNAIPALAIQRIFGCFLSGCCYGTPTDLPWGVCFPLYSPAGMSYPNIPIHPAQLYYGISALFIYAGLYVYQKKNSYCSDGRTFALGLMGLSLSYFLISFFRGDHLDTLSYNLFFIKLISVGSFIAGGLVYIKKNLQNIFRRFILPLITITSLIFTGISPVHASNLTYQVHPHSLIKWGETLRIEINATNPSDKQAIGNITVSFNNKVILLPKDNQYSIFSEDTTYYNNKNQLVPIKHLMVKKHFDQWKPHQTNQLILTCIPVQIGLLKIFIRATCKPENKHPLNIPDYSTTKDQLGFPVRVENIFIDESPSFIENFLLLSQYEQVFHSNTYNTKFRRLLKEPEDIDALRYFGFMDPRHAKKEIRQLSIIIGNTPQVRQSPDLLNNLKLLLNEPDNSKAQLFFGLTRSSKNTGLANETQDQAKAYAQGYIMSFQGGYTLIQTIDTQGDIHFVQSNSQDTISIRYQNQTYSFNKTKTIVYDMASKLEQIKPNAPFEIVIAMVKDVMYKPGSKIQANDKIYISYISLFEPIKKQAISSKINALIQKPIQDGITKASQKYPFIEFNKAGHTIENTPENLDKLIAITLNPKISADEKKQEITNQLMHPNNADAILSGNLFIKDDSVEIRLYLFVKTHDVLQQTTFFKKQNFFCDSPVTLIRDICPDVPEEIYKKIDSLFSLL